MARTNVVQSHPQDWVYLSEGGSTIVFSYTGPFHPSFTGKVLRLRKTSLKQTQHDKDRSSEQEEDDPVITFQKTVVATLVPPHFLPDLDLILLESEWLTALEVLRDRDRPAERRENDQIDKFRQKGVLATDLVGGTDVLAVEIKPKWGFMPNPAHLSQETAGIKMTTCRFCMHTCLRSKDHVISTQYCPLDFYSTDQTRKRKAIRDLWDGWLQSDGALNNMRVFVSGKCIKPSESYSSLEEFLSTRSGVPDAFTSALLPSLLTPALKIVADLQRSLDALDIEGIAKLYAIAHPDTEGLGALAQDPSLEQLQDFVASYYSVYCALDHSKLCPRNTDTYVIAHLLSATFKDCSLIFRICRSDILSRNYSMTSPRATFMIDLDLKGVDRLERWANLDREIVEYYRNTVRRRLCVE